MKKKKKKKKFREATTDERRQKRTCIGAKHGAKEFFLSLYGGTGFWQGLPRIPFALSSRVCKMKERLECCGHNRAKEDGR